MQHAITIQFDTDNLSSYSDAFLAQLWHVGQANPAPITDRAAGEIAENIGREIVRRWLEHAHPALWDHQGRHHASAVLSDHGHWPGPTHDRWVFGKSEDTREAVEARAGALFAAHVPPPPATQA